MDRWERNELACKAEGERIVVLTKCDGPRQTDCDSAALETSSVTGQGIVALRDECAAGRLLPERRAAMWLPTRRPARPSRFGWPANV